MEYLIHIFILIGIYSILTISLNLIMGYTGLLSIAHATFYGIGAYAAALLSIKLHSPFILTLSFAIVTSIVSSTLIGIPTLRIKDDYFVIATFALQVISFNILNNLISFTGGPIGLPGIPIPSIFGIQFSTTFGFLLLVSFFGAFTFLFIKRIIISPFGRVLKAIREDEVLSQATGKNVASYKILVFTIGSALAAIAGVLFAYYISFIDPTSFTVMESIFMISIVIIGGSGSMWGPVIGSVLLVILPEILRFIGLPSSIAANFRQIIYGGLLVAFMLWRPRGLIGEYSFLKGKL